jgi:hypothetical protein
LSSPALAVVVEQEESQEHRTPHVRLYSSQRLAVQDEVAPQHAAIDSLLARWGYWNAEKYRANSCYSVESRYREQTARATGHSVDPLLIHVERAVLGLPVPYRDTIRAFYVMRESPSYIWRLIAINQRDAKVRNNREANGAKRSKCRAFVAWMFTARAMVVNLLRIQGVVL